MKKRFALYKGVQGHLVGDPRQGLQQAKYFCQRRKRELLEVHDIEHSERFEPTCQVFEVTNAVKSLTKAVNKGHLLRSPVVIAANQKEALELLAELPPGRSDDWSYKAIKQALAATKPDPEIEKRLAAEAKKPKKLTGKERE